LVSNLEQQILSAGVPPEAREGACAPHFNRIVGLASGGLKSWARLAEIFCKWGGLAER